MTKNQRILLILFKEEYETEKKTTTKNVVHMGKYSELLKATADPLAYAIDEVKRYK
jgi:hypothetical protein